jgi:hypothetical protein
MITNKIWMVLFDEKWFQEGVVLINGTFFEQLGNIRAHGNTTIFL